MKKTHIYPEGCTVPRGAYSPGLLVEHGGARTLFVTGQLAVDPDGGVIAPDDATVQTEFIFGQIGAILGAAKMGFGDVVKVQTFLTNMHDFEKFTKPVSTLLEVKGLAHEGCCVEIEVVAVK